MKSSNKTFAISIILISILVIGFTLYSFFINDYFNWNYYLATDKLGHFGDFIGGLLGTFLTVFATVYIYKTYISQKSELEEQRNLINHQQFETTFFNLLNTHREIKKDLKLKHLISLESFNPIDYSGISELNFDGVEVFSDIRSFHSFLFRRIVMRITPLNEFFDRNITTQSINNLLQSFNDFSEEEKNNATLQLSFIYEIVFNRYQSYISHYCRNIYQILKFIREKEFQDTEENKNERYKKYANIFQSQLNVDEQFLLFYNFIHFDDESKGIYSTINLVNHYQFLENLGRNNLLDINHNNNTFYQFDIK